MGILDPFTQLFCGTTYWLSSMEGHAKTPNTIEIVYAAQDFHKQINKKEKKKGINQLQPP